MLLHLAIGDAYGAGFEYVKPALLRQHNHLGAYFQHPRHQTIRPGQYTDDTQMSLAVAEALLESPRPTAVQWAEHFYRAFQRDPREGYASRFYDFLRSLADGSDFLQRIKPHSEKSGACMRALPVGLLPQISEVMEVAAAQARLTHDTPGGIQSARAVALAAHYFLYRLGPVAHLDEFLRAEIGGEWSNWRGRVGETGLEAARAALSALQRNTSMAELLRQCVDYTGDVDTVACIALGAAACSLEYRRDLPRVLFDGLERGRYGHDYLARLQDRLAQRFPRTTLNMTRLTLWRGDITKQEVDAIVNAANSSLLGGGGVDGAIHRAGGPAILEECRAIRARQGGCETGQAVITTGGDLKARHVIHTVGPVWRGGKFNEPELLRSCYTNSLRLALENGLKTVAFPCISTGVFGYPADQAAPMAVDTVRQWTAEHPGLEEVRFVVFSAADFELYRPLIPIY